MCVVCGVTSILWRFRMVAKTHRHNWLPSKKATTSSSWTEERKNVEWVSEWLWYEWYTPSKAALMQSGQWMRIGSTRCHRIAPLGLVGVVVRSTISQTFAHASMQTRRRWKKGAKKNEHEEEEKGNNNKITSQSDVYCHYLHLDRSSCSERASVARPSTAVYKSSSCFIQ